MAYQHSNRVREHFSPLLAPAEDCSFQSKARKAKLSNATQAVFYVIVLCLNEETNSWPVSYRYLRQKTHASKQTITRAISQLVEHGFLTTQPQQFRATSYSLGPAVNCPEGCENLEIHNTNSELMKMRARANGANETLEDQIPRTNSQAGGVSIDETTLDPVSGPHKERKTNKKKVACSNCSERPEFISGIERKIHSDGCPALEKLRAEPSWQIAQGKYGPGWDGLTSREQQAHYWVDYQDMFNRKGAADAARKREQQKREEGLMSKTDGKGILPNWLRYVKVRDSVAPASIDQTIQSAEKYSALGQDIRADSPILATGAHWDYQDLHAPKEQSSLIH